MTLRQQKQTAHRVESAMSGKKGGEGDAATN
jgi:hypothetical protein